MLTMWILGLLLSLCSASVEGNIHMVTQKNKLVRTEGGTTFAGRVALEGENITVICRISTNMDLWRNMDKVTPTTDGRIEQSRDSMFLNTTITNVTLDDTGLYRCGAGYQNLRIYRISGYEQVPPTITGANCLSYTSTGNVPSHLEDYEVSYVIVCSFSTNTLPRDYMDWSVALIEREGVECGEEDEGCTDTCTTMNQRTAEDDTDIVSCMIITADTATLSAKSLQFSALAKNPFTQFFKTVNASVREESEAKIPEFVELQLRYLDRTTPLFTYTSAHSRAMVVISGAKWVQPNFNDPPKKLFMGYAAKAGDTVIISCEIEITGNALYNISNENDPRVSVSKGNDWYNTTIEKVSHEDAGTYYCSNDNKKLAVIEADKEPAIMSHHCESAEFHSMVCTFYTNSNKWDVMEWNVLYSVGTDTPSCTGEDSLCHFVECKDQRVFIANGIERIVCSVKQNQLFRDGTYDFHFTASNPFIRASLNISGVELDLSIVTFNISRVAASAIFEDRISLSVSVDNEAATSRSFNFRVRYTQDGETRSQSWKDWALGRELLLTGLKSHTVYDFRISCQLSSTKNLDTWSEEFHYITRSATSAPEKAPKHSITGYILEDSTSQCGESKKMVTILWKPLLEKAGYANGVISHYSIYSLHNIPSGLSQPIIRQEGVYNIDKHSALPARPVTMVYKKNVSATACISSTVKYIALVPSTFGGAGSQLSLYQLPAERIAVRSCDISVKLSHGTLTVSWPGLTDLPWSTSYTVYWCEPGDVKWQECLSGTLDWKHLGRQRQLSLPFTSKMIRYKFGLSARSQNNQFGSGIVWADCVDTLDSAKLTPAEVDVEIDNMVAHVTVSDRCSVNSRRADRYTVKSCQYDTLNDECMEKSIEQQVTRCEPTAVIQLFKYSQNYSFWVTSHVGSSLSADSTKVIKLIGPKALEHHVIAIICILLLLLTTGITLLAVWIYRQKKMAKTLKRPEVIIPIQLKPDSASDSEHENDEMEKFHEPCYYLGSYETGSTNYMASSIAESTNDIVPLALLPPNTPPYVNHAEKNTCSSLSGYLLVAQTQAKHNYYLGPDQSDNSFSRLPNSYFRNTCTDADQSLSSELFLADVQTGDNVIDISTFIGHSGSELAPPLDSMCKSNDPINLEDSPDSQLLEFHENEDKIFKREINDNEWDNGDQTRCLLNSCSDNSGQSSDTGYITVSQVKGRGMMDRNDSQSINSSLSSLSNDVA